ncbi:MAG: LuxR C-terminal-related transcriptional regulator [Candidatus Paceibacterota bacterium]
MDGPAWNGQSSKKKTRVLWVGADRVFRDGLSMLVADMPGFTFCKGSVPGLFERAQVGDVLVLDIDHFQISWRYVEDVREQEEASGEALISEEIFPPELLDWLRSEFGVNFSNFSSFVERAKTSHGLRVLVVAKRFFDFGLNLVRAGALGFLLKTATPAEFTGAIDSVSRGEQTLCLEAKVWIDQVTRRPRIDTLTPREIQVFNLLGDGMSAREIASELCVSPATVGRHQENMQARFKIPRVNDLRVIATTLSAM